MKEKRILEALSEVKDEFVEEVDVHKVDAQKDRAALRKRRMKKSWGKWLGMVAVLAVVIAFGAEYFAPKAVCENYFSASVVDGMSSLKEDEPFFTKNPYLMGMPITEYPVYKNLSYVEGAGGEPHYFTEEELLAMAEEAAEKLGTEITNLRYATSSRSGMETRSDAYKIIAQSELAEIRILGNGKISIFFYEEVELPEEYQFSDENDYMEAVRLVDYLTEAYADLLGFEKAVDDCSMYYGLTGCKNLSYSAYNAALEEPESLTEYCFHNARFYGNEKGLSMIHYGDVREAAEYLGDYEIISEEEARQRLEEGSYISVMTTEKDALGGAFSDENIILVELTYLTGSTCQYYQPYYCFYVEMESIVEGLSSYGTFYVPALTDENLSQFPEENPIGN